MGNVPFIPQEGITQGILSAINMANQQHADQQAAQARQQQLAIAQQEANTASAKLPSETAEATARTANLGANTNLTNAQLADRQAATAFFSGSSTAPPNDPAHVDALTTQIAGPHAQPLNVADPTGQQLAQPAAPVSTDTSAPTQSGPSAATPTKSYGVNGYIDALDKKVGLLPEERAAISTAAQLAAVTHDHAGFQKQVQDIIDKRNDPSYARYVALRQQGLSANDAHQKIAQIDGRNAALTKIETDPAELSGEKAPAAVSQLQGMLKDATDNEKPRIQSLLTTAKTAVTASLAFDAAKQRSIQAAKDGDPKAAGALLASGDAEPNDIKARMTPDFYIKAVNEAKKIKPDFNAPAAQAQFEVAKSPANTAFFGSARSLTDKGGTLDQLIAAGKAIPDGKIPIFNSLADAQKAATGNGPLAKYAAVALSVADDSAKVQGGGVGSDNAREQALKLIPTNASPEARQGAVDGIRGGVNSQIDSRIGTNTVMQRMYGRGKDAGPAQGGGVKVGDSITQNGHTYTVREVKDGKVTQAD